jgi:DNA uptake protein and related DNA-binding proteins
MNLNREPIKNWFGFTRRERRSTFIMLLIIILIIGLRYTIPESRIAIEDITGPVSDAEIHSDLSGKNSASNEKTFFSYSNTGVKFREPFDKEKGPGNEGDKTKKPVPFAKLKQQTLKKASGHSMQLKSRTDINASDSATLVRLPGIGPVLSARIIKYRRLLGGFARIDQLKEVYGLPDETFEMIKGRVFADSTVITRININSASYKELSHIHYLEKYEVTTILKYRELKGRINSIYDLTENKLITAEKAGKVGPYLKYDE